MKYSFTLAPLLILFPLVAAAQELPPSTDLRQLVEAMQKVAKPTVGEKLLPVPSTDVPKQIRIISTSNLQVWPLPLMIDNQLSTLDSLDRYTLSDAESVRFDKSEATTAIFGTSGSWGVIYVKLKTPKPVRGKHVSY